MNTSITLPPELTERARQIAAERGMTLSDLVRTALERIISTKLSDDPLFSDAAVFVDGGPTNFAADHDDLLYGDHP